MKTAGATEVGWEWIETNNNIWTIPKSERWGTYSQTNKEIRMKRSGCLGRKGS